MVEQIPKQVGIRELKTHLSTYVKWAEAGHDITITGGPLLASSHQTRRRQTSCPNP